MISLSSCEAAGGGNRARMTSLLIIIINLFDASLTYAETNTN